MLGFLATLALSTAWAENIYRTERIFKLPLKVGEHCGDAWARYLPDEADDAALARVGATKTATLPLNSFAETKDRICIVTLFSVSPRSR